MIDTIKKFFYTNYQDCKQTINTISHDSTNNCSLVNYTDDSKKFYNFDVVVTKFYNTLSATKRRSADMILFGENLIFIEFKNSPFDNIKMNDIKLKAIESAYIFLYDILKKIDKDFLFENIFKIKKIYIVVYSGIKTSRKYINNHLKKKINVSGINKYEKTFFNDISFFSTFDFINKKFNLLVSKYNYE